MERPSKEAFEVQALIVEDIRKNTLQESLETLEHYKPILTPPEHKAIKAGVYMLHALSKIR